MRALVWLRQLVDRGHAMVILLSITILVYMVFCSLMLTFSLLSTRKHCTPISTYPAAHLRHLPLVRVSWGEAHCSPWAQVKLARRVNWGLHLRQI